ncbi:MAG: archease [Thermoplasmata archaeon]|nr:archease [Thermoplasmata archaeon]
MRLPRLPAGTRWGTFPTTADTGLWARSPTLDGLLSGLGTGLFAVMTDLRRIRPTERREVRARARDIPGLAVGLLSELIVLEQTEEFVARRVMVRSRVRPSPSLVAEVYGERWSQERHDRRKEVKAVTLHRLEVTLDPPVARVILDI